MRRNYKRSSTKCDRIGTAVIITLDFVAALVMVATYFNLP